MQTAAVNRTTEAQPGDTAGGRTVTFRQRLQSPVCIVLGVGTCVIALLWLIMIAVIMNERHAAIEHAQVEANNLSAAFSERTEPNIGRGLP